MINKHDGRQFMSEYTVMCVCTEGETERESYKMQVRGTTFASQRISPFVNP